MDSTNLIAESFLVAKLNAGDKDAFSAIFSIYYNDLVLFAQGIVKDLAAAEEITQETFLRLWTERESLEIKVSLKSFLLKSVQNKCIDTLRHRKIKSNYEEYCMVHLHADSNNTESYILMSEMEDSISRAIEKLPDKIKESFLLNRAEGLKYREIAAKLGVSVRTVEVRIGKALEMLRKELTDFF